MPDMHFNDGAAWRKARELHFNDGAAWRKAKEVWAHDGAAWRKVFSGSAVVTPVISDLSDFNPTGATVGVSVSSDGTVTPYFGATSLSAQWYSPTTVGIGAGFWVRRVVVAGAGSTTGWQSLSTAQNFPLSATGLSTFTGTWRLEFASDSAGASVVATSNDFSVYASTQNPG